MGKNTKIEYCDSTCNPVPFCLGCELYNEDSAENHCYAKALSNRMAGLRGWPASFQSTAYFPHRIERALRWSDLTGIDRPGKPWLDGLQRIIFLNDIGDGFSPLANPHDWLSPWLNRMANSPHIWLFLTKWPRTMATYFDHRYYGRSVPQNFWLGTSVTGTGTLFRLNHLTEIRNANLWLSMEPLLDYTVLPENALRRLGWIVAGGESGPNARISRPDWFRLVRDDCKRHEIPFFFKQWGDADPGPGSRANAAAAGWSDYFAKGGDTLDGQHWKQVPWW